MALTKVSTPAIKDEAITLAKLLHGDSNSNGKFLRANNGADPSFESIPSPAITAINNATNNRLVTSNGGTTVNAEAQLTFDGNKLVTQQTNSDIGLLVQNTTHDSQLRIEAQAANKNSVIQFADGSDGDVGMIDYDHNDNSLSITVNTLERLKIDSNGRFLIAKGTPNSTTSQLQIGESAGGYTWDVGDVPQVLISGVNNEAPSSGTLNIALRVEDENANNMLQIHNRGGGNTDIGQVYIAGSLGVGTDNPAVPLETKASLNEKLRLTSTLDNTNYQNVIGFYNATNRKAAIVTGNGGDGNSLGIRLDIGSAEKARLDKDGNFQVNYAGNTGTYIENFNGSGNTTYGIGGKLNVHGGIRVSNYSSKGSHSSNGENVTAGLIDFLRPSQFTRGGGLGYFTMGWKTTCRSGEVIHTETSTAYKKDGETNTCAYYLEAGASGEAGGLCLDENCVYVYGSSDNGQTFRITDKDSDVVVAEMTQSSWNWNVRGNVNSNQTLATISDQTVKKSFKDVNYTNILTDFAKLQLKSFIRIDQYDYIKKKYNDQEDLREVGLVAQDVEPVFPDCIAETKNLEPRSYKAVYEELGLTGDDQFTSLKNLNVNGLLYKTIAAVQELIKENTALKNRVATLETA